MSCGTSYLDCFRGIHARRTEIASAVWTIQAFCGSALIGYSTLFYLQAGLSSENAFNMSVAQHGIGALGTLCSWVLMSRAGRRTLYITGLVLMSLLLLVIGFCGLSSSPAASWAVGSMLLVYTFIYGTTVGPVCFALVSEIPSTRLKIKTVVLARSFYNMASVINNLLMPHMIGPNSWDWDAKSGLFWGGITALLVVWCYFRLPEPKGRTFGELDVLFERKVSARRFAKTSVDQFEHEGARVVVTQTNSPCLTHERVASIQGPEDVEGTYGAPLRRVICTCNPNRQS